MIIGVDLDNTIICYDELFHRVGCDLKIIPPDVPVNKKDVKDYLHNRGLHDTWTELQGVVYGPRLKDAPPFAGVLEFFQKCREKGIPTCIISHKTRLPALGPKYDLHQAAVEWLEQYGFFDPTKAGLTRDRVKFNETRAEKIQAVIAYDCTHFIDDLPEVYEEKNFPHHVDKYLFAPADSLKSWTHTPRVHSWEEIERILLK